MSVFDRPLALKLPHFPLGDKDENTFINMYLPTAQAIDPTKLVYFGEETKGNQEICTFYEISGQRNGATTQFLRSGSE